MNCAEVMRRLSDYIDGELGLLESLKLRRHLLRCEACARQLRVATAFDAKVTSALEETEEFPDLRASIMAALPDRPVRARRYRAAKLSRALAYGLVGLSIGVGALLCYSPNTEQHSNTAQIVQPSGKTHQAQPRQPEPVNEPQYAPIAEATKPQPKHINPPVAVARIRKPAPKPEPVTSESEFSVFSVTVAGRSNPGAGSSDTPAAETTVAVMGKTVPFGANSSTVVERPLAANFQGSDVDRHPLESVVKTDPLLDRILVGM